jgi:hypothetical protein
MASSALRSGLRSTVCMQAVDLKTKLHLRLTGRHRRSVENCGVTRSLPRSGPAATSLSGPSNWPSARRRWDSRYKLARQPDLRNRVGKSLAMGHSPEQIAGRLALEHGRVIISHESIYRFIYHRTAQARQELVHLLHPRSLYASTLLVERFRHRLRELGADRHRVNSAQWPISVAEAAAKEFIDSLADAGQPNLDGAIEFGQPISFASMRLTALVHNARPGAVAYAETGDAIGLVCW